MARTEIGKGYNMSDWVSRLAQVDESLAVRFREDRTAGFRAVEKMGLPRSNFCIFNPLTQFFTPDQRAGIQGPQDYVNGISKNRFFVSLAPRENSFLPKYACDIHSPEGVVPYIQEQVPQALYEHYDLVLGELLGERVYGGAVVVHPNGRNVLIEMVDGGASKLTRGETPPYTARRDEYTGLFSLSPVLAGNENARIGMDIILESIKSEVPSIRAQQTFIPARERVYLPGYYEFLLMSPGDGLPLLPNFTEYKDLKEHPEYLVT